MKKYYSRNDKPRNNYLYLKGFVGAAFLYLLIFTMYRVSFLVWFNNSDVNTYELFKCFMIGARYDFSFVCIFILSAFTTACFIMLIPGLKFLARFFLGIWLALINVALLILAVAEFPFYYQYSARLNHLFFEYFSNPKELLVTLNGIVPLTPLLILLFFLSIVTIYLSDQTARAFVYSGQDKWLVRFISVVIMAVIAFIGVRGGFQRRPLNWGSAFFSSNNFLNQLALNGPYNLFKHIEIYMEERTSKTPNRRFMGEGQARQILKGYKDSLVFNAPMLSFSGKPNVVIVVMESFSPKYIGAMGAPVSLTPNFDKMAKEGGFFTNFYACATRTSRGLTAFLASYPPLPGVNLTKKVQAQQEVPNIAHFMGKQGYSTMFFYGGDSNFEGMKAFFTNGGYSKFYGSEDMTGQFKNPIGLFDEDLFANTLSVLDAQKKPFLATVMTLTNHGPFTVPAYYEKQMPDMEKVQRAFKYSDHALGKFMEEAKKHPWYKNTVFVITADHSVFFSDFNAQRFRIPLLIYSPLMQGGFTNSQTLSQLDFAPTLLNMLALDGAQNFIGADFTSNPGFAYVLDDPYFGVIGHERFYRENIDGAANNLFNIKSGAVIDCKTQACPFSVAGELEDMRSYSRAMLDLSRDMFFSSRAKDFANLTAK